MKNNHIFKYYNLIGTTVNYFIITYIADTNSLHEYINQNCKT